MATVNFTDGTNTVSISTQYLYNFISNNVSGKTYVMFVVPNENIGNQVETTFGVNAISVNVNDDSLNLLFQKDGIYLEVTEFRTDGTGQQIEQLIFSKK